MNELAFSVATAPKGGKANAAVIDLLAKTLRTPKSSLSIERGQSSRNEILRIAVLTEPQVRECLMAFPLEEQTFNEPDA